MTTLVGLSGNPFIIASIAAHFVLDRKFIAPGKQMAKLLDRTSLKDFLTRNTLRL